VVTHTRAYAEGKVTTLDAHRTKAHHAIAAWSASESLAWSREIGPATEALLTMQLQKLNNHLFGYRTTQAMKKHGNTYGKIRLEEACVYAVAHKVTRSEELRNILSKNLDCLFARETGQEINPADPPPTADHENIRGAEHYDHILANEGDEES